MDGEDCVHLSAAHRQTSVIHLRICKEIMHWDIDQSALKSFLACRLVPLDKNPGVRPVGICDVARRIISKTILKVIGKDIQETAGTLQLCAGQPAGIEAAIHSMRQIYEDERSDALLLVDATNAFNQLNRRAALITQ